MKKFIKGGIITSIVLATTMLFGWSEQKLSTIKMIATEDVEALSENNGGNDPIYENGTVLGYTTSDGRLLLENKVHDYTWYGKMKPGCLNGGGTCDTFAWLNNSSTTSSEWASWISTFSSVASAVWTMLKARL